MTLRRVLVPATAAVVAVGWLVTVSWWTHAAAWHLYRYDVAFRARLDADTLATFPPLATPRLVDSITQSVDAGLPFVAVVLLGTALVMAGRRWWALGTVVALTLAAFPDPLGGTLLLSPDVTMNGPALPLWWPWNEIVLEAVVASLPVLVGAVVRNPTPVSTGRALLPAGAAAAVVGGWAFTVRDADSHPLLHASLVAVVVLATGLVTADGPRRRTLAWLVVLVALVAFRLLLGDRGIPHPEAVPAGPVAVLGAPWVARTWVRLFRPGVVTAG